MFNVLTFFFIMSVLKKGNNMKRKKKIILALNLLLGGFAVSTLAGCGEEGISSVYTLDLQFNSELGSVTSETPKGVAGDTVTVKITPNEGIVVDSIKVNGEVEIIRK